MSTTEERIAAALTARAGEISMETSTIEQRLEQVRARGRQDRQRRRGLAVGAAALAAAAAVAAVMAVGGVLDGEDTAAPRVADGPSVVEGAEPASTDGFPLEGTTYVAQEAEVPFAFTVPDKGDLPGRWHYGGEGGHFMVNLDDSPSTGFAAVEVLAIDETYAPTSSWRDQTALVPAPTTRQEWLDWLAATGHVQVSDRQEREIGGVPATTMTVDVTDLPGDWFSTVALLPIGPATVGEGPQAGLPDGTVVELTLLELPDRVVLAVASGAPDTADRWLPVMRQVVDSLRFP